MQPHAGVDAAGEDDLPAGVDDLAVVVGSDVRAYLHDLAILDEDVSALEGLVMVDYLNHISVTEYQKNVFSQLFPNDYEHPPGLP